MFVIRNLVVPSAAVAPRDARPDPHEGDVGPRIGMARHGRGTVTK